MAVRVGNCPSKHKSQFFNHAYIEIIIVIIIMMMNE